MFRTATIAGITAIALAAAPQAEARSNLDRFLIGATALAIIGSIAASQSRAKTVVTPTYVEPTYVAPRYQPVHHNNTRTVVKKKVIITKAAKPKHCLRQRWERGQWVTFYGKKCLANHSTTTTKVIYKYR